MAGRFSRGVRAPSIPVADGSGGRLARAAMEAKLTGAPPCLEEAREILRRWPAIDLHTDTLGLTLHEEDLLSPRSAQADPARLEAGGFGAAVYAVWIPAHLGPMRGWSHAESLMRQLARLGARAPERIAVGARSRRAPLRLLPAIEDARVLSAHPERVDALVAWGVCYVTLTWNAGNRWATSWEDARGAALGLTDAGHELVEALDERGILPDLSHLSDRAAFDVIGATRRPPLVSHSSARGVCGHPRNVSDALAKAVADRGGVIGINFHRPFLRRGAAEASLEDAVAHIEHLWRVAGDDTVAIGSDFDGIPRGPIGLDAADRFPALVARLLERGHGTERIRKLAHANGRRILGLDDGAEASR
jgi:membrane dipeptidase